MITVLIIYGIVVFLFVTTYVINKRTKKPEGTPNMVGCGACANVHCGHHQSHVKEDK